MYVSHAEEAYASGVCWPPSGVSTEITDEVRGCKRVYTGGDRGRE